MHLLALNSSLNIFGNLEADVRWKLNSAVLRVLFQLIARRQWQFKNQGKMELI